MSFELLSKKLQLIIKEKGFYEPTLPQKLGIPQILKGSNVLVIAPTGIGKTETVMLPLFDKVHTQKLKPISVLYITPLKSLNRDLLDRLFWWSDKLDLEVSVRHGDTSQKERAAQREMPSEIMITTPESLQAVITGKKIKEHLKNVKHVVIDEIHELVGNKRGVQLSLGLERLKEIAGNFQRIGLSATVGSPEIVANFLDKDVKIINAESLKKYEIRTENPKPNLDDVKISEELLINPEITSRLKRLLELIKSHKSIIIFTNTRESAEVLSSRLSVLDKELKQDVHHGSLSKEHRIKSEQSFKKQELKTLIATSSLELGIDIGSVNLVIQYMSPRQVCRLIQRVGRSGHKINQISKGIILSGDEDLFESIVVARHSTKRKLEQVKVHELSFDVLVGQIIGLCIDEFEISDERIYKIIKRSWLFRNIRKKDILELLKFMESIGTIWLNKTEKGYSARRRLRSWRNYFENLSTIPDTRKYRVMSVINGDHIGELDEAFVAENCKTGEKIIISGRAWKVIQVEGNNVIVEPIQDIESSIPSWEGELIPVPFEIAKEVGLLRELVYKNSFEKVKNKYNIDKNSFEKMKEIIKKHCSSHKIPDEKNFLIENYKNFIIIHSCSGSLVNDTIGKYIASQITKQIGVSVNIKTDSYRIIFQTVVKKEFIKKILENCKNLEEVLINEIQRGSLFKWRFLQVAKRFGVISKMADFQRINLNKIVSQYYNTPIYKETLREIFLEKLDVLKTKEIFEKIKTGKIKIHLQEGLSYLGELGLQHQFSEVMKPDIPKEEIFSIFKKRLLGTRMRLLCAYCSNYSITKIVRDIEKQPECPKCFSRLIAVVSRFNVNADKILKKKKRSKKLTTEETKELQKIRRTADLVIVYGKKAVETLAGRGIGPETASRVLSKLHTTREKLYKDILEAEKQFVKTKKYWKR